MESIGESIEEGIYPPQVFSDHIAEGLNFLANEMQRPFWYSVQNVHKYALNPLNDSALTQQVASRILNVGVYGVGTALSMFIAIGGFFLKGLANRLHSRAFTYWEGRGEEVRPYTRKVLHLNVCMFPGGLPYLFGGVKGAGERLENLKIFIQEVNPDIFFLSEFSQTLSGKLYDLFAQDYKHFFVNIGSNALGMDVSMAVVSREPIVSEPKFFPSNVPTEGDQKFCYRGYFFVETEKVNYLYIHLHPKDEKIRQQQLLEIMEIVDENQNGKGWVVLGDSNIQRGTEEHEAFKSKGFEDIVQKEYGNVETCINGLEKGARENPESIDGVFVLGDVSLRTTIHETYETLGQELSDHKGISAVID
ncbi:MAG: endonuclease/exonuclease/phosphatase family protein [Chlamydiia bacterium]|nr:endonuclease/exonuclease/phosphatase family protein [Chlamydiia bacterium]